MKARVRLVAHASGLRGGRRSYGKRGFRPCLSSLNSTSKRCTSGEFLGLRVGSSAYGEPAEKYGVRVRTAVLRTGALRPGGRILV